MQSSNRNNKSPVGTIFTLLAFVLGFVLYIIIKQNTEAKSEDKDSKKVASSKRKQLYNKADKTKQIEEEIGAINLTERQEKIVQQLEKQGKIYPSELQKLLSDVSSRTIRRDMTDLEKKGVVEQKGMTKSTYYVYINK